MKLIIVANRLPFSVKKDLTFVRSPGGLVSGLLTFLKKTKLKDYVWIGWPGRNVDKKNFELVKKKSKKYKAYPVYIPPQSLDKFYNGFCNKTLWPLFHNFQSYTIYDKSFWECYVNVNKIFYEEVIPHITPDSIVWIHDYHLMLLPGMLREKFKDIMIGFFLHIPFPPPELFMQLPWRREILEGLLGCDLIGFHVYEYTNNFLRSLARTLGIEHKLGKFFYQNRVIKVDTFPMGVDFSLFNSVYKKIKVKKTYKKLKKIFKDKKIIFSVDRLDYTKGIYNRLLAFEDLLLRRPDLHEKVTLIMVVVPSREGVEHYQRMKKQLEEKISEINGKFSTIGWTPVLYYYRSLNFEDLTAHYLATDVILVTPLKDGMNLIAKEFIASRADGKGVLILSEFAGSAKELGEAIIINPNSVEEISKGLEIALSMSEEEQKERNRIMQERLKRYDIVKWGMDFIDTLKNLKKEKEQFTTKLLNQSLIASIKQKFDKAKYRIIFTDYDGTLVPIVSKPDLAVPQEEVKYMLKKLASLPNTDIVLISGRKKEDIEKWFGDLDINFVAEHGSLIKKTGNKEWEVMANLSEEIKEGIKNIMEVYVYRLPGAFIEEKECSIVFHYRLVDPELANIKISELIDELILFTGNIHANLLLGDKVIEVKAGGVDKGIAANLFLKENKYDFILAMGDDKTDEDLFKVLPEDAITIKVGLGYSLAKFSSKSYEDIIKLLKVLANE